jgi:hypothetical protein
MRWVIIVLTFALLLIIDGGRYNWRYTNTAIFQMNKFGTTVKHLITG